MTTTWQYDRMVAEMPPGLPASIMKVLTDYYKNKPGVNVTKQEIILQVYGVSINKAKLSATTEERQVRDAIADLQLEGYPIIASSGRPGYRLAANEEEKQEYISELEARIAQLKNKVRALRDPRILRYEYAQRVQAVQPSLI